MSAWRIGTDTLPDGKIRAISRGIGQGRNLTSEPSNAPQDERDEHRAVARELARRIRPGATVSLVPVSGGINRAGLQGYDWEARHGILTDSADHAYELRRGAGK